MLEVKIPSGPIVRQLETGRSEMTLLNLDARIPLGPIEQKWDRCRFEMKLVNPANRRKHIDHRCGRGPGWGGRGGYAWCSTATMFTAFAFTTVPAGRTRSPRRVELTPRRIIGMMATVFFRLFYDT